MRISILGLIIFSVIQVAAAAGNLGPDAKKELKKSKADTRSCKAMIISSAINDGGTDRKRGESQARKTLKQIDRFCGRNARWFDACKVISSGRGKCVFVQTDKATRLDDGSRKYFPRDFR